MFEEKSSSESKGCLSDVCSKYGSSKIDLKVFLEKKNQQKKTLNLTLIITSPKVVIKSDCTPEKNLFQDSSQPR